MKAIILAAGKGKRLHSEQFHLPKVLRQANGKSLISYVLENLDFIQKKDTIVVVGYKGDMVKKELGDAYSYALQQEQLGTGHAVAQAKDYFQAEPTSVLVTYGDMPLFRRETYQRLCQIHKETGAACTILTGTAKEKLAYGRIIRKDGEIVDIVEEKDCTPEQREIRELNVGVYVFESDLLFESLKSLKNNNAQGEYYLTDVPKILINQGQKVTSYTLEETDEIYGVNTVEELERCEKILKGERV